MAQSANAGRTSTDVAVHERVFAGFVRFLLRAAAVLIVILILVAMFNG